MDAGDVYRQLAPAVLGYLRGQRVPDPEGVLGEVFVHVTRSLHRFSGNDEDLRRWVFTIARHRVIDDVRHRSRRPQTTEPQPVDLPGPPDDAGLDLDLLDALGQLSVDQREVVALRFVADLPLEDVARITGRSVGAVKSMQLRGLTQLARILGASRSAE